MSKMQPFWYFIPPPFACPEGEQVVNGGFETGDWTGWTYSTENNSAIGSSNPRSGKYHARLWRGMNPLPPWNWVYGWIRQDFPVPIRAECFTAFGYWARVDQAIAYATFTIGYDDGSQMVMDDLIIDASYRYHDHLSSLASGKKVSWFKIQYKILQWDTNLDIDDVTGVTTQP